MFWFFIWLIVTAVAVFTKDKDVKKVGWFISIGMAIYAFLQG